MDDRVPSTSVLVDVVYVLGGDVVVTSTALQHCDREVAERLLAAAALMGIARQIMHEIAASDGLPTETLSRLATDAANAAGWISGDDNGTEWLRAG